MPRVACLSGLIGLMFFGAVLAQRPTGVPTLVNGVSPQLQSQPLWFGNSNYGYQLSNAPTGATGVLAHSIRSAAVSQAGINLGLSLAPSDLILLTQFSTDSAGGATISLPFSLAFDPSLVGIQLYAQAAVADPLSGNLGATRTLLLDISRRPLMFLAEVGQAPLFADPFSGQLIPIAANYSGAPVAARFINGGTDLLLLTTGGIFHCDSTAPSPSFTQWTTGAFEGLEWDAIRRRVVSYLPAGGTQILDGDRSSARFGQILQQLPGPGPMALSADGTRGFRQNGANFELIDFDPASASFGQAILSVPQALTPGIPVSSEVSISSDGRLGTWFYTVGLPASSGRHIMDLTTGTWIDHNPFLVGLQPQGVLSSPSLNPTDVIFWRRDDASGYLLGVPNAPRRIDRNLDNLAQYTITLLPIAPLPVSLPLFFSELPLGLTSSGRFAVTVVTSVPSFGGPRDFYLIEPDTGIRSLWFQRPAGGLSYVTAWR